MGTRHRVCSWFPVWKEVLSDAWHDSIAQKPPVSTVLRPDPRLSAPPAPLVPLPALTTTPPPRPAVAAPEPSSTAPLFPPLAEPELNTSRLLAPATPPFAVRITNKPLLV